jgi:hypothetical protein
MKRARYDGPSGTGVDVAYTTNEGEDKSVHVDPGHQLPDDVPAKLRDSLLEQAGWSEVNQAGGSSGKSNDEKSSEEG